MDKINKNITTKTFTELCAVQEEQLKHKDYASREKYRNKIYGGLPPAPYESWGDYWKSV